MGSAVLCVCGPWSLTLREEHRLGVFESRVLERDVLPREGGSEGNWRYTE